MKQFSSKTAFMIWTKIPSTSEIEEAFRGLFENSSSKNIDKDSLQKLIEEIKEFEETEGDKHDLMLELADITYYCFKLISYYANRIDKKYTLNDAIAFCFIKYMTRRDNKKNPVLEKEVLKDFYS
jgi:hypothetical protein